MQSLAGGACPAPTIRLVIISFSHSKFSVRKLHIYFPRIL